MRAEPDDRTPPDSDEPSRENSDRLNQMPTVEFVEEVDDVWSVHIIHDISWVVAFKIAIAMVVVSVVASAIAWFLILRANAGSP